MSKDNWDDLEKYLVKAKPVEVKVAEPKLRVTVGGSVCISCEG